MLEATVVVLDNSEWMRNGDYAPSRMEAQRDAALLLCNAKRQSNVESALGVIAMAGPSPQVLVTLTGEQGKLQHAIASVGFPGHATSNLASTLRVAQLILKNRQNPNQRQRIVLFTGSPTASSLGVKEVSELSSIGKALRKNGVSLDVIQLSSPVVATTSSQSISTPETENAASSLHALSNLLAATAGVEETFKKQPIEDALQTAVDQNCSLLIVPIGFSPSSALMSSPILSGESSQGMYSEGLGNNRDFDSEMNIDDEMDPELALALKLSLEEERNRIKSATKESPSADVEQQEPKEIEMDPTDEDAMLAQAIAMSLESAAAESSASAHSEHQKPDEMSDAQ